MRQRLSAGLTVLVFGVMSLVALTATTSGAQSGGGDAAAAKKYFGTWPGTWEGAGDSGGLEVTLEAGEGGKPSGQITTTGAVSYTAKFKTIEFSGNKMTATYVFPPDPAALVTLGATFDGAAAKGTWSVKGGAGEPLSGTWTVKKK